MACQVIADVLSLLLIRCVIGGTLPCRETRYRRDKEYASAAWCMMVEHAASLLNLTGTLLKVIFKALEQKHFHHHPNTFFFSQRQLNNNAD